MIRVRPSSDTHSLDDPRQVTQPLRGFPRSSYKAGLLFLDPIPLEDTTFKLSLKGDNETTFMKVLHNCHMLCKVIYSDAWPHLGERAPYPEGWASPQPCGAEISDLLKSTFLYETFQFFNIENKFFLNAKTTE